MTRKAKSRARKSRQPTTLERAEAAGEQYANDQVSGEHFMSWVQDQLIEASRMDPDQVLPLETKADASKIARRMLRQLEWDTKHQGGAREALGSDATRDEIQAFYEGFHRAVDASSDWLADELLEQRRGLRGGGAEEAPRRSVPSLPVIFRAEKSGDAKGRRDPQLRDYIAVDRNDRRVAGPFRSQGEAQQHVPPGGYVKFSSATRRHAPPAPSSYPMFRENNAQFEIVIDEENNAEQWWDEARERANGMRYPDWTRLFNRIERGGETFTQGEVDAFLAQARQIPGWDDGPTHARNPVVILEVAPSSYPMFREGSEREVAGKYLTQSGKVGALIHRSYSRGHGQVFSYYGEWGAGSGLSAKDMRANVDSWLRQKRGVQIIIPFTQ